MNHANHPSALPQAFQQCEIEVIGMKNLLTINGYDPESMALAQGSSKPGKRKQADVWNVSSSSASTSSLLPRAQCVPVCVAQALLGAFDDLKAAMDEYKDPNPLKLPAAAPIAPTGTDAKMKAELAAKDKTIRDNSAALRFKDEELKKMQGKLESAESQLTQAEADKKDSMQAIIDGAKAQGACMHLRLHRWPSIHHAIICFLASRNRSCRSTGGRAYLPAPAEHDNEQRRAHEQHQTWCFGCRGGEDGAAPVCIGCPTDDANWSQG